MYNYCKGLFSYMPTPHIPFNEPEEREFNGYKISPRPTFNYSDPGVSFTYAGKTVHGENWDMNPFIASLKERVEREVGDKMIFLLCALYPDGSQDCPWHSDTVRGDDYIIANVSFGAPRIFQVRYTASDKIDSWVMEHGDMLVMRAPSQEISEHQVPAQRDAGPRLSLTFRNTV